MHRVIKRAKKIAFGLTLCGSVLLGYSPINATEVDTDNIDEEYSYEDGNSIPCIVSEEEREKYVEDGSWDERVKFVEDLQDNLHSDIKPIENANNETYDFFEKNITPVRASIPSKGNIKSLVFVLDFANYKNADNVDEILYENFISDENKNDPAYPYESVKAFFARSSYNQLIFDDIDIVHVELPYDREYYDNPESEDFLDAMLNIYKERILEENDISVEQANDFWNDYLSQYDSNGDNTLDAVYIRAAGPEEGWGSKWWSYVGYYSGYDIGNYTFGSTCILLHDEVSAIAHETGHMLGLPDAYADSFGGYGMASNDLMQCTQGDINVFFKMLLHWVDESNIKVVYGKEDTANLTSFDIGPATEKGEAVIIVPEARDENGLYTEFYMVTYKEYVDNNKTFFTDGLSGGICIYHINAQFGGNSFVYGYSMYSKYEGKAEFIEQLHIDDMEPHGDHNMSSSGKISATVFWNMNNIDCEEINGKLCYKSDRCLYHNGDELTPYTTPSSALCSSNLNEKKYSGIYVDNINISDGKASFRAGVENSRLENSVNYNILHTNSGTENAVTTDLLSFAFDKEVSLLEATLDDTWTKKNVYIIDDSGAQHDITMKKSFSRAYYIVTNDDFSLEYNHDYTINIPKGTFKDIFGDDVEEINIPYTTRGKYPVKHKYIYSDKFVDSDARIYSYNLDTNGDGYIIYRNVNDNKELTTSSICKVENFVVGVPKQINGGKIVEFDNSIPNADGTISLCETLDNGIRIRKLDYNGSIIDVKKYSFNNYCSSAYRDRLKATICVNSDKIMIYKNDGSVSEIPNKVLERAEKEGYFDQVSCDSDYEKWNSYVFSWDIFEDNTLAVTVEGIKNIGVEQEDKNYELLLYDSKGVCKYNVKIGSSRIEDIRKVDGKYYVFVSTFDQSKSMIYIFDSNGLREKYNLDAINMYKIIFVDKGDGQKGYIIQDGNGLAYVLDEKFNVVDKLDNLNAFNGNGSIVYNYVDGWYDGVNKIDFSSYDISAMDFIVEDTNEISFSTSKVQVENGKILVSSADTPNEIINKLGCKNYLWENLKNNVITDDTILVLKSDNGVHERYLYFKSQGNLVKSIALNKTNLSLDVGKKEQLVLTISPTNATNKTIKWTSSNSNIAKVSSSGIVTAVSGGTVTITAATTDGTNKKVSCEVTVLFDTPVINKISNASTGVKITWNKIVGAEKYRIYKKNSTGSWEKLADTVSTSYTDKTAISGSQCTYTVKCINNAGTLTTSKYDKVGKTIIYMQMPKIKSATNISTGVKLSFDAVKGAGKYKIYRKCKGESWTAIAETTSTTYVDKNVKSGITYIYTMRSVSKDKSQTISAYDSNGTEILYISMPKITSLSKTTSGVKVVWGKVPGAAKYRVYRKTGTEGWKKVGDTTSASYVDKTAVKGKTYYYTVKCVSADGKTATSAYDKTGKSIAYK